MSTRRSRFGTAWFALLLCLAFAQAHGNDLELSQAAGFWRCQRRCRLDVSCARGALSVDFSGTTVDLHAGKSSDLVLDIGCSCSLPFTVVPGALDGRWHAELVAPTPCLLSYVDSVGTMTIQTGTLEGSLDSPEALQIDIAASGAQVDGSGQCTEATLSASWSRTARTQARCPAASAAGVVPYRHQGKASCPVGVGLQGVTFWMHEYHGSVCDSEQSGEIGDAPWALPPARKDRLTCHPSPGERRDFTYMPFCRIDGGLFKPLTTDPTATEQFYALLKLSPQGTPCPPGSSEITRWIDNEDEMNGNRVHGDPGPNFVGDASAVATGTELHFCFFRAANNPADTMPEFPDLGFPYAVFHDFDGPQPPWVSFKHWFFSREATNAMPTELRSVDGDEGAVRQFRTIVEQPGDVPGVEMELARVR